MATGSTSIDFGAQPGTQRAVVTVNHASVLTTSMIEAFLMSAGTGDNGAYEHEMVPMRLTCGNIVNATSFDIVGVCEWPLHGTWNVYWVFI